MIDVSIIIVSYNTRKLLKKCLASIKKHTKEVNYEVIVVDNASTDGSVDAISNFQFPVSNFHLIRNGKNLGFARANNQGVERAKGRYILLLNSDTKLKDDTISEMIMWMDGHKNVGIATCRLVNPDGETQATGGYFPNLLRIFLWASFLDDLPLISRIFGSFHPHGSFFKKARRQDWVTGAFFLVRREAADTLGGLDEKFFMYVEEVDYCFRARKAGWEVWYVPEASIVHEAGASGSGGRVYFLQGVSGKEGSILGEFKGLQRFYKKHYPAWQYPFLSFILRLAAFLRIVVFGIFGKQEEARKIYARALATV